jgi:hypothetical protein
MIESHQRQIDDGRSRSLVAAGIGQLYHERRLSQIPGTEEICEWANADLRASLVRGEGWNIVGSSNSAVEATILLGKAVHLSKLSAMVVPLVRLMSWLQHETEDYERASSAKMLLVTDFYQVYPGGRDPFTGWQLSMMETFIRERIASRKSTCLHFATMTGNIWWSESLLKLVANVNKTAKVI